MRVAIDLDPAERATIQRLLRQYVPDYEVRAFGSRVKWRARQYSDLDLVLLGDRRPSIVTLGDLCESFADSDLPFKVDVLVWDSLPDNMRREISRNFVVMQEARDLSDWRETTIGRIAEIVGGGTPPTKDSDCFGGDIPWLTPKDLSTPHSRYVAKGARSLTPLGLEKSSAKLLPPETVLLTTRAPIGYVAIAETEIATNQGFRNLILNDDNSPEFLFYWMRANTAELYRHASGSTFRELPGSVLKSIRIRVPTLAEQTRIAEVLGALDDRIDLNRRMCETLEELAQALYKAWFVDFEPVRAKMEGRWREGESLPGLPAEAYGIFPNQLVHSRLGTIPAGWNIEQLGDAIELEYGKALKASERKHGPIPVHGSNGQIGWHDESLVRGPGIIVGRKGNPGTVRRSHADFFPIDTTFYVVARDAGLTFEYLYYMLQQQQLPSVTSDSAVPGLNRNLAYTNLYARPSGDAIAAFTEAVSSSWSCEQSTRVCSQLLGDLRDTLLPKLISGELRVSASAAGRD